MTLRFACLTIALAFAPVLFAQTIPESESAQAQRARQSVDISQSTAAISPAPSVALHFALPSGENAWGVQILSRGGFTGAGRGDLTLTSEGRLTWSAADGSCGRTLSANLTQHLGSLILAFNDGAGFNPPKPGECLDCYISDFVIQRREAEGVIKTFRLVWDDSTGAQVQANVSKICAELIALKGCNL